MTWFKVDDKLHSHRKVAALGNDVGALALWTIAGSWSADHLTDGFVPAYMIQKLLPIAKSKQNRMVFALVSVGLWTPFTKEVDGKSEEGWLFHGWNERGRQPTSEQILADRDANAERQAAFRERKKAERNAVTGGVRNGVSNGSRNGTPTRPDQVHKQQGAGARDGSGPTAVPAGAIPLIDALTVEGFVVAWDLGFVEWDRIRLAVEKSGIPAMVEYVRRRNAAAKEPAYSARAWIQGWSTLPTLDSGAQLRPAGPSPIGAPSEAAAMMPPAWRDIRDQVQGRRPESVPDFGADAFGMPA